MRPRGRRGRAARSPLPTARRTPDDGRILPRAVGGARVCGAICQAGSQDTLISAADVSCCGEDKWLGFEDLHSALGEGYWLRMPLLPAYSSREGEARGVLRLPLVPLADSVNKTADGK